MERQLVGIYGALGLTDAADVFLAGGYIIDAENSHEGSGSGSGFIGQAGFRGLIKQQEAFSLRAYGIFNFISEDYGEYRYTRFRRIDIYGGVYDSGVGETTATIMEVIFGIAAAYDVEDVRLYAGIEAVPFQASEIEGAAAAPDDLERADIATGRLGVQYAPGDWWLRGELSVIGETAFTIGVGVSL